MVFDLYCTEYCGRSHSQMIRKVYVHQPQDFQGWLAEASKWLKKNPPVVSGQKLWEQKCATCHSLDGSAVQGPSWLNLFGARREFSDGTSGVADWEYLRESILYPQREIVRGYENAGLMPTFKGQLNDDHITALVEFIKSKSPETYQGPILEAWPEEAEEPQAPGAGGGAAPD